MKRRIVATMLLVAMLMSLLAACGGNGAAEPTEAPQVNEEVTAKPVGNFVVPEGGYDGSEVEIVF